MDECEALCSRIGFMNRGTLIGIGTSQHLKSRYGNSFMLAITVANPCAEVGRFLDALVVNEFGAKSTLDLPSMSTLHWEIPRDERRGAGTWSRLFRRAQSLVDGYPLGGRQTESENHPQIKDFSLTQNSLQQVFLRLSQLCEDNAVAASEYQKNI